MGHRARNAEGPRQVKGLPEGFRYHDLRQYFARLLIADTRRHDRSGPAAARRAKPTPTLPPLWPDRDESTRAAVNAVLTIYRTEQRWNSALTSPETAGQSQ